MPLPQRMTAVTLGARSVPALRAFYASLGWHCNEGSDDTFTSFTLGGLRLGLYPLAALAAEAAPGEPAPATESWNGVTFTLNLGSQEAVVDAFRAAVEAGAVEIAPPAEREWGGYSGYVADPEGHRWEIAWAPGFPVSE